SDLDGKTTTEFIGPAAPSAPRPSPTVIALAALLFVERGGPPAPSAGWRASPLRLAVEGVEHAASVRRQGDEWVVTVDGEALVLRLVSRNDSEVRVSRDGIVLGAKYARDRDDLWLDFEGAILRVVDRTQGGRPQKPAHRLPHLTVSIHAPAGGATGLQEHDKFKTLHLEALAGANDPGLVAWLIGPGSANAL